MYNAVTIKPDVKADANPANAKFICIAGTIIGRITASYSAIKRDVFKIFVFLIIISFFPASLILNGWILYNDKQIIEVKKADKNPKLRFPEIVFGRLITELIKYCVKKRTIRKTVMNMASV